MPRLHKPFFSFHFLPFFYLILSIPIVVTYAIVCLIVFHFSNAITVAAAVIVAASCNVNTCIHFKLTKKNKKKKFHTSGTRADMMCTHILT